MMGRSDVWCREKVWLPLLPQTADWCYCKLFDGSTCILPRLLDWADESCSQHLFSCIIDYLARNLVAEVCTCAQSTSGWIREEISMNLTKAHYYLMNSCGSSQQNTVLEERSSIPLLVGNAGREHVLNGGSIPSISRKEWEGPVWARWSYSGYSRFMCP